MSKPSFVVQISDLERGPKSIQWDIPVAWLRTALEGTEATPRGDGELSVEVSKDGPKVMVRGHARASLTMPCARTLDPVDVEVTPDVFLLLSPSPADVRSAPGKKKAAPAAKTAKPGKAGNAGNAAKPHESGRRGHAGWSEDPELSDADMAGDTYTGDWVALDDFLREFIVLELPMFPMRRDLPSDPGPAIAPPHSDSRQERPIDPRLMPLAAIASRLRQNKE